MRVIVSALLLGVLAASEASAQIDSSQVGCKNCLWREDLAHKGTWTYKYDSSLGEPRIAAAESNAMRNTLSQIAEIAHATPVMSAMSSINAWVWARLDQQCPYNLQMCHWKPLGAWEAVIVDEYLVNAHTGAHIIQNQESPRVHIGVNDPTELYIYGGHKGGILTESGYDVISVLQPMGEVQGLPLYDNQLVVVAGKKPLFVQITREQYIRGIIHTYDEKVKLNPDEKPSSDFMNDLLRKELAAMSAEERASPAFGGVNSSVTSMMVDADAPGATPLMIFNPSYFDTTLPRTAVQLITVRTSLPVVRADPLDPEIFDLRSRSVWELRNTADYANLRMLLDPRVRD